MPTDFTVSWAILAVAAVRVGGCVCAWCTVDLARAVGGPTSHTRLLPSNGWVNGDAGADTVGVAMGVPA